MFLFDEQMKSKFLNNVPVYIGLEMIFQANDTDF